MVDAIAAHKSFVELIAGNDPVLIDFYSDWNGPSKELQPILEEIKRKMGDLVILLKINVDKNPKAQRLYNIQSVPTLMIFKNNEIKWRQNGAASSQTIEKKIRENL